MKKTNLYLFLAGVAGVLVGLFIFEIYFQTHPPILKKIERKEIKLEPCKEEKVVECPQSPGSKILPPPQYSKKMANPLQTDYSGEATVKWEEVPYAYRYYVRVYNSKGKLIRKWKTKYDVVYVKGLPFEKNKEFTNHQITLSTVNYLEQDGPESERRTLQARRLSNLLAPAIESVIIED